MAYADPPFNTGKRQTRRTLAITAAPRRRRPHRLRRAPLRQHAARRVLLRGRLRRLPRLPGAAPARAAAPARPRGHAVPAPRLPRGARGQAGARRDVRPRVLPQRADLGLRLRRQAAPPLAAEARHDPRLRQATATATTSTPRRSTASPTWRRAWSPPSSASAASARRASCGTRSSPPPAARRPATRRRSPRRSCGASCRPRAAPGDLCLDPFAGLGHARRRRREARPALPAHGLEPGRRRGHRAPPGGGAQSGRMKRSRVVDCSS